MWRVLEMREMMMFQPADSHATGVPLHILLADDNSVVRVAVEGLLRSLGHSVRTVTNGCEAVEAEAREEFDIVLMDVQMPEMDGLEATHAIRRRFPRGHRPRIIGISGEVPDSFAASGMDDFLLKPIRLTELVRSLRHSDSMV